MVEVRHKRSRSSLLDWSRALLRDDKERLGSHKTLHATLCGLTAIAISVLTLWPFDFFRANGVAWIVQTNGIRFDGPGVVVGERPLSTPRVNTDSCTLEILLRPAQIRSLHTILSFYTPSDPRQLMIRQLNDGLLLSHDFAGAQNGLKTVKVGVDHIFQQGRIVLITITYGVNGLAVYTDGEQRRVAFNFPISQADFAGQIILGTSPVHYDPWLGEVHGLAVYSRELTPAEVRRHYQNWTFEGGFRPLDRDGAIALYSFSERAGQRVRNDVASSPDLQMPERFVVPHKPFLQSPKEHFEANWYYLHDVLVNIAGFVPLGFLLCSYLARTRNGRQAVLFAILAGGTLSFIIEVLQAYIPQRDSGMTDVITNTLGTALGAAIGLRVVSSINSVVNRTT